MAIADGFTLWENTLTATGLFNTSWLLSLIIVVFVLILITRDFSKWKTLALPVIIIVHIAGIEPSILMYIVAGLIFAIEALSIDTMSDTVSTYSREIERKRMRISGVKKGERKIDDLLQKLRRFRVRGKKP